MATIEVDLSAIDELKKDLRGMSQAALGRLAERGYQLLRREVPVLTGNLKQGVAPPDVRGKTAVLTVSARSARRGARQATLHLKSGKTKAVKLRATPAFNYAETVALGRPAIRAKRAKVLLVPVQTAPNGESYIEADGQLYILRTRAKAVKANPYHERAAAQLESEAPRIVGAVIEEFA